MSEESKEMQERAPSARSLDCGHGNIVDFGKGEARCNGCGQVFPYCEWCSTEEGAVFHLPPLCSGTAKSPTECLCGEPIRPGLHHKDCPAAPPSPADLSARETELLTVAPSARSPEEVAKELYDLECPGEAHGNRVSMFDTLFRIDCRQCVVDALCAAESRGRERGIEEALTHLKVCAIGHHEAAGAARKSAFGKLADDHERRAATLLATLEELRALLSGNAEPQATPRRDLPAPGGKGADPATCVHAWEGHLWERGKEYCPYCFSMRNASDSSPSSLSDPSPLVVQENQQGAAAPQICKTCGRARCTLGVHYANGCHGEQCDRLERAAAALPEEK